MKISILLCASNEEYPRKHNSEENWKLLKNMTKVLYTLVSNRIIKGKLHFALSSLVFSYFLTLFAFHSQWSKRRVWKNTLKTGF